MSLTDTAIKNTKPQEKDYKWQTILTNYKQQYEYKKLNIKNYQKAHRL
jgi:hypothetical protein